MNVALDILQGKSRLDRSGLKKRDYRTIPMEYELKTRTSHFFIRREPLGMWDLWVNDMPTLTFASPQEAAQAVYRQDTGYIGWDQLETLNVPPDLSSWQVHDS